MQLWKNTHRAPTKPLPLHQLTDALNGPAPFQLNSTPHHLLQPHLVQGGGQVGGSSSAAAAAAACSADPALLHDVFGRMEAAVRVCVCVCVRVCVRVRVCVFP